MVNLNSDNQVPVSKRTDGNTERAEPKAGSMVHHHSNGIIPDGPLATGSGTQRDPELALFVLVSFLFSLFESCFAHGSVGQSFSQTRY